MNKILIILRREYLSRVKKRSFIIMTILGPILFAGMMFVPVWLAQMEDTETKTIAVIDESFIFRNHFEDKEYIKYEYLEGYSVDSAVSVMKDRGYYAVLYIPVSIIETGTVVSKLYSYKQPALNVKIQIASDMEKVLEDTKLQIKGAELGISQNEMRNIVRAVKTNVDVHTIKLGDDGEQKSTSTEISMIIGYIAGFLIYMFVFMYGSQVMRGVIEEKSNRIVEIIVSSVKPFTLMMGKIIGVAMVGLTQFILWIILTIVLFTGAQALFLKDVEGFKQMPQTEQIVSSGTQLGEQPIQDELSRSVETALNSLSAINFPLLLISFVIYFLFGYLLYAGLFAAVGSAVDNEADTQQFMLPITIPLVLGIIVMFSVINNPESSLAWWFSIIPFTSPIVMMVRIPFGVPVFDLILSWGLLIITFIFTVWLSGKIYRTGILMYGKKVNYKEVWKWLRYKN
ncbi:MAG: ABC transporter permease [Candidatus Delongbacteria bacterium]|jgi:ABC-2 type transport system permease protein|nr:ABC transporter permease [Candidatus Delongbacteria bacterium]